MATAPHFISLGVQCCGSPIYTKVYGYTPPSSYTLNHPQLNPQKHLIENPWVGYGCLWLFTVIFKIFHGVELQVSTLRHPKTIWIYLGVSEVQIGYTVIQYIQYTQFVPFWWENDAKPSDFGGFSQLNSSQHFQTKPMLQLRSSSYWWIFVHGSRLVLQLEFLELCFLGPWHRQPTHSRKSGGSWITWVKYT